MAKLFCALSWNIGAHFLSGRRGFRCRFDPSPLISSRIRPHLRSKVVSKLLTCNQDPSFYFGSVYQIIPFQYGDLVLKLGMGIFSWILLGLIAGALAKFIMPGKDPGGIFVTILIGIVGAIVGGFLGSFIGLGKVESFDLGGIFIATIGAIILLIVYRLLRKRT